MFVVKGEKFLVLTETEKRVVGYIKEYRKKGYSNEKIKSALLKSGVSQTMINKCFKIASNKVWLFVLFSLLVIGALVLGYFLLNEVECVSDKDCGTGYDCKEGECILVIEEGECTFDADCEEGYECLRGECLLIEEEEPECYFDSDCDIGYDCESGVCERAGIEPQCGDGECVTGEESCYLDCGCTTNTQCQENDLNYLCGSSGQCYYSLGISGGSSSSSDTGTSDSGITDSGTSDTGTTASVCDDVTCSDGFVCYEITGVCGCDSDTDCSEGEYCDESVNSGTCISVEVCNDGIDNDLDSYIDFSGGCDEGSDGDLDFVCGDISELFTDYEVIDSEGICNGDSDIGGWYYFDNLVFYASGDYWCDLDGKNIDGIVFAGDSDCGLIGSECNGDYDCGDGLVCEEGVCVEETISVDDVELEICNDGIDNDLDSYIDFSGGCDVDSVSNNIEYVCGCQNDDTGLFSNYGDLYINCDLTETYRCYSFSDIDKDADDVTCSVLGGTYYSMDSDCVEIDCNDDKDDDRDGNVDCEDSDCEGTSVCETAGTEEECSESNPCENGYTCEEGVCVAEEAVCSNVLPECADGVDNDADGNTDLDDSECVDWEDEESGVIDEEEDEEDSVSEIKYQCNDLEDNDADNRTDYYGVCEYSSGIIVSCSELVNIHDYNSLSYMYYDCKDECEKLDGKTIVFDIGCNSTIDYTEENIEIEVKDKIEKNEKIWKEIAVSIYDLAQLSEWNEAEIESKYSNYYLDLLFQRIDESVDASYIAKEEETYVNVENMNIFNAVTLLKSEGNSISKTYEILLSYDIPIDYAAILVIDVYGKDSIDTLAINLKNYGITPIQSGIIAMNLGVDIESFVLKVGYSEEEAIVVKEIVTQSEVVYLVAEGMSYSKMSKLKIKNKLIAVGIESNVVDLAIENIDLSEFIVIAGTGIGLNIAQGIDYDNVVVSNSFSKKAFAPEDESLWDRIKSFFMEAYSVL